MKLASVSSAAAIRARTALAEMRDKSVPPAIVGFLAGAIEDAPAPESVPGGLEVVDNAPAECAPPDSAPALATDAATIAGEMTIEINRSAPAELEAEPKIFPPPSPPKPKPKRRRARVTHRALNLAAGPVPQPPPIGRVLEPAEADTALMADCTDAESIELEPKLLTPSLPLPAPPPTLQPTRSVERLLRALLHRPRSETDVRLAVEAAEIPERVLQAAVAALGIQRQDGQWRLLG